jgi:hypothetical protein
MAIIIIVAIIAFSRFLLKNIKYDNEANIMDETKYPK